jgi:hypothetical protein
MLSGLTNTPPIRVFPIMSNIYSNTTLISNWVEERRSNELDTNASVEVCHLCAAVSGSMDIRVNGHRIATSI